MRNTLLLLFGIFLIGCSQPDTRQVTLVCDVDIIPFSKVEGRLDDDMVKFLMPDTNYFTPDSIVLFKGVLKNQGKSEFSQKLYPRELEVDDQLLPVSAMQLRENMQVHFSRLAVDKVTRQELIVNPINLYEISDSNHITCVLSSTPIKDLDIPKNIEIFNSSVELKNYIDSMVLFESARKVTVLWKPTIQTNLSSGAPEPVNQISARQEEKIAVPSPSVKSTNIGLNYDGSNRFSWNTIDNARYVLSISSVPDGGFARELRFSQGSSEYEIAQNDVSSKQLNGYTLVATISAFDNNGKKLPISGNSIRGFKLICGK